MSPIADFFIKLWLEATQWPQHELEKLTVGDQPLLQQLESRLKSTPDEASCLGFIRSLIPSSGNQRRIRAAKVNCILAIDRVFSVIHPRASAGVNGQHISPWLKDYLRIRTQIHAYAETDTHLLIPNGPLKSAIHPEGASGAFVFADYFFSLRVVPKSYTSEGRTKSVQVQVIAPNKQITPPIADSKINGQTWREAVLCMPVADDAGDLDIQINDGCVHVTPNLEAFNPAQRWIEGLSQYEFIDMALGSEFAMTSESVLQLNRTLYKRVGPAPHLIVVGTFYQLAQTDQPPFNQVQVVNGRGQPLWTQNKNWPAQMKTIHLEQLGVSLPPDNPLHYNEANQAGDGWVVADLDELGRCLILICQDLKCEAIRPLIRDHQPDWVFSPIFDRGVDSGRWMHQEVFDLSKLSQARFVVVSGLSWAKHLKPDEQTPFVMAHGPSESRHQNAIDRVVAFLNSQPGSSPQHVLLRWDQTDWQQSSLTTTGQT